MVIRHSWLSPDKKTYLLHRCLCKFTQVQCSHSRIRKAQDHLMCQQLLCSSIIRWYWPNRLRNVRRLTLQRTQFEWQWAARSWWHTGPALLIGPRLWHWWCLRTIQVALTESSAIVPFRSSNGRYDRLYSLLSVVCRCQAIYPIHQNSGTLHLINARLGATHNTSFEHAIYDGDFSDVTAIRLRTQMIRTSACRESNVLRSTSAGQNLSLLSTH